MEDIVKNNKLIAEFMNDTNELRVNLIGFDYEWDWCRLMEVVEKIESFKTYSVYIKTNGCTIQDEKENVFCVWLCREVGGSKILSVYNSCVEFINWYNSQS